MKVTVSLTLSKTFDIVPTGNSLETDVIDQIYLPTDAPELLIFANELHKDATGNIIFNKNIIEELSNWCVDDFAVQEE